jgi:hypothetical protein
MDLIHFTDKDRRARAMRGQIDYIRLYDSWTNMDMHRLVPGSAAVEWGINDERVQYVPFWRNPYVHCADKDVLVSLWRLPDRVLMVAFNGDGKQAKDVTLKIDLDALNLRPRPWKELIGVRAVEDPGEYGRSSMPKEPEPTLDIYANAVSVKGIQPHTARIIGVRKY